MPRAKARADSAMMLNKMTGNLTVPWLTTAKQDGVKNKKVLNDAKS
jgi:hypothetical protein